MISGAKTNVNTIVIEKKDASLSPRLMELRRKIHDEDYLENAILRIAQVISRKLVEHPEELQLNS